ncbi:MAG: type II secretion system protein [Myxococcaceae bacterium]|nr:type II secretion system protein [Myxococcaceae bacterium]MBH2006485.1 type II secretion system protein [Myxococcaceae bacterium]
MLAIGNNKRGFSLIEMMVVLLLVGVFAAIAVPTLRSVTGSRLKRSAIEVQALIRDTYSRAGLSGKTCRIVFDLDNRSYWVEESSDWVRSKSKEQDEEEEREAREMGQAIKKPEFKPVEDELGKVQSLKDDVFFKSIWIEHFEKRESAGHVALYFFPDGYTESAQIILADDPDAKRLYNLIVEPLTGSVMIEDQELPIEES